MAIIAAYYTPSSASPRMGWTDGEFISWDDSTTNNGNEIRGVCTQGEKYMKQEFNDWWNGDDLTKDNPFKQETPAFWAWEGWVAGVKAEREACAKVCDEEKEYAETWGTGLQVLTADKIATAIRARSEK